MHTDDASSAFATREAKHNMNHAVVHAEFGAGRSYSVPQIERIEKQVVRVCADGLYARVSLQIGIEAMDKSVPRASNMRIQQ